MSNAYDFEFQTLNGKPMPLKQFAGKPLVIVNTASKCGFTPQYAGLQELWEAHRNDLVIIGVPCNDFGNQEPGSASEIGQFCQVNYGVGFPMAGKVHVKGQEAHPFFRWAGQTGGFWAKPRWNFYKYLINGKGELVGHYSSLTSPKSNKFKKAVQKLIG